MAQTQKIRHSRVLRHRQTKGAATDNTNLLPPRPTPTLPLSVSVVHVNDATQYREDFLAVVDVPVIRLISPMQSHADPCHICDIQRAPGSIRPKVTSANNLHLATA